MPIVDSHHHLWDLEGPVEYAWMKKLKKPPPNYALAEFKADRKNQDVVKSVAITADADPEHPEQETAWLQSLADGADSDGFPHGIVAFADLSRSDVERALDAHKAFPNTRGIRQVLSRAEQPDLNLASRDFLADDAWWKNFGLLRKYELLFDMMIAPGQLEAGAKIASQNPDVTIVLNHMGMPREKGDEATERWRRGLRAIAEHPNVVVKVSGFGISKEGWKSEEVRARCLETIETFGIERCMFASNFPVDGWIMDYDTLWNGYKELTSDLSEDERSALFHDNAARVYRL